MELRNCQAGDISQKATYAYLVYFLSLPTNPCPVTKNVLQQWHLIAEFSRSSPPLLMPAPFFTKAPPSRLILSGGTLCFLFFPYGPLMQGFLDLHRFYFLPFETGLEHLPPSYDLMIYPKEPYISVSILSNLKPNYLLLNLFSKL